jgi:hypothetical protein
MAVKETYGLDDAAEIAVFIDADPLPLDAASGELSVPLLSLPDGARVASATATLTGHAFHGLLANLAGARVMAASVIYGTSGTTSAPTSAVKALIVDFGRPVSVLDLRVTGGEITLVLPWLGIDFAKTNGPSAGVSHARLSGLETQKLFVQVTGSLNATSFGSHCTITTGTVPANVRASVNGRPPFWTHPGSLTGSVEVTGLAAELNAVSGDVVLNVATDAPGVLALDFDVDVDRVATASWGGRPTTDVTVAALTPLDIVVPFVGGDDGPWLVSELSAAVAGSFPPWRAYPAQSTVDPGPLGLKIVATCSAARRLVPGQEAEVYGLALPLRVSGPAELHVALVPDLDDGKPLAAATITPAAGDGWYEVLFGAPVKLSEAWLVVQAKTGAVEWAAAAEAPSPDTRTLGAAGSARWAPYPVDVVAQARLLRKPFAAENDPLLTVEWDTASATLDPGATVVLTGAVTTADHTLTVRATAQSSGTLTLGPATAVYP